MHKYLYGHDNPISYIDPSGHFFSGTDVSVSVGIMLSVASLGLGMIYTLSHAANYNNGWQRRFTAKEAAQIMTADQSAYNTLRATSAALANPNDATLLRVAHWFSPADAGAQSVPAAKRTQWLELASDVKGRVDDLIAEWESWDGNDFYKGDVQNQGASVHVYSFPRIDTNSITIHPPFFNGGLRYQSTAIIHEMTHAYQQRSDGDGYWSDDLIYVAAEDANGAPLYYNKNTGARAIIRNRWQNADTWAHFMDSWYTP